MLDGQGQEDGDQLHRVNRAKPNSHQAIKRTHLEQYQGRSDVDRHPL